jgi:hypothetical protein
MRSRRDVRPALFSVESGVSDSTVKKDSCGSSDSSAFPKTDGATPRIVCTLGTHVLVMANFPLRVTPVLRSCEPCNACRKSDSVLCLATCPLRPPSRPLLGHSAESPTQSQRHRNIGITPLWVSYTYRRNTLHVSTQPQIWLRFAIPRTRTT